MSCQILIGAGIAWKVTSRLISCTSELLASNQQINTPSWLLPRNKLASLRFFVSGWLSGRLSFHWVQCFRVNFITSDVMQCVMWWSLIRLSNHLQGHYSQCQFVHRHLNNVWCNKADFLIETSCLVIIAIKVYHMWYVRATSLYTGNFSNVTHISLIFNVFLQYY